MQIKNAVVRNMSDTSGQGIQNKSSQEEILRHAVDIIIGELEKIRFRYESRGNDLYFRRREDGPEIVGLNMRQYNSKEFNSKQQFEQKYPNMFPETDHLVLADMTPKNDSPRIVISIAEVRAMEKVAVAEYMLPKIRKLTDIYSRNNSAPFFVTE